ncbi:relaxase, partial [Pseudomonas aeruginosa]
AARAVPDVMEDMLAMVGMGDLPGIRQDAEAVSVEAPAAVPEMPASSVAKPLPPAPASTAAQPSGEHFMAWLQQGVASRRLIIND